MNKFKSPYKEVGIYAGAEPRRKPSDKPAALPTYKDMARNRRKGRKVRPGYVTRRKPDAV